MNIQFDSFRLVAPVFVAGAVLVALASPSLKEEGHFEYQPNPLAMSKSPFGRTVGMALQGPVTKFWDMGVGRIERKAELVEGSRPDEKLFNWVTELREAKADAGVPSELSKDYTDYAMARIEKKLALAWKMDPRNFANYAIYQMFLWEGFNQDVIEAGMDVRELSLQTLEASLADEESPVSMLTAGQAAYDLVFAARTSTTQSPKDASLDIKTYSRLLPEILTDYEELVAEMQDDGRWDEFSEAKKNEFSYRKAYLEHLNDETRDVLDSLTKTESKLEGGLNS